jgi:hypothetical protein
VEEHAAQLNLFLGQNAVDGVSDWVSQAKADEGSEHNEGRCNVRDSSERKQPLDTSELAVYLGKSIL